MVPAFFRVFFFYLAFINFVSYQKGLIGTIDNILYTCTIVYINCVSNLCRVDTLQLMEIYLYI